MLSLLSPARDKTVAQAAIQAGADAIYIGAPAFGARQAAGNSIEDLAEVVRFAATTAAARPEAPPPRITV